MGPFLSAYAERPLATRELERWEHPGTPLEQAVLSAVRRMRCVLDLLCPCYTAHLKR